MEFKLIKLSQLEPAKRDPRIAEEKPNDPDFRELVDSIRAFGVVEPIVVRVYPGNDKRFQICAGSRRVAASRFLKKDDIPALVYDALDDSEATGITFAENKGRKPLSVIEQALAVDQLLEAHGGDEAAVASLLGKTPREIRMLGRVQALIPAWRSPKNDLLQKLTLAHLALVARLPAEIQKRLLDSKEIFFGNRWNESNPLSVAELEKALSGESRRLSAAMWDSALCASCKKRSDSEEQRDLFEDEAAGKKKAELNALCLDTECWAAKLKASVDAKFVTMKTEGLDPIRSGERGFYSWNYKAAKKGEKGARPLLDDKGGVSYVKQTPDAAKEAQEKEKRHRPDPAKALKFKRQKYALELIRGKILKIAQTRPRPAWKGTEEELLRAIFLCGVEGPETLARALKEEKKPEIQKELFERLACSLADQLSLNYCQMESVPADTWALADWAALTMLGEKIAVFEAAAEVKFPDKKEKAAKK